MRNVSQGGYDERPFKIACRVTAASIALSGFGVSAFAGAPATPRPSQAQTAQSENAQPTTDFSSRRRHYRRNDAAAIGAMLAIAGTVAAIAASRHRHRHYYYGYRQAPYYGGYYGYGRRSYYGPRYYRYGW